MLVIVWKAVLGSSLNFGVSHSIADNDLSVGVKLNALGWAALNAVAAANAFLLVNLGKEVLDMNGIMRAGLLAFHTANAADLAGLAGLAALIMVAAEYHSFLMVQWDEIDNTFRAGLNADFAGTAGFWIDFGNAVGIDVNGVVRAGSFAVAKTETSVGAGFTTGIELRCSFAAQVSMVFHGSTTLFFAAFAHNHCSLRFQRTSGNAENLCNFRRSVCAAWGTEGGVSAFALGEGGSVAGTSGVSAGTAVGAGEYLFNFDSGLIDRYSHDDRRNGENDSEKKSGDGHNNYRN